eukprot:jgi/Mesvir1/11594/Mv00007-RA.1
MEENASTLRGAPPREFVCPLSLELLKDPVAVVETGEVYERSAIEGWFRRGNRVDPWTRQPLSSTRLTPLRLLRRLVEEWVEQQSTRERLGAAGSGGDDDSSVPLIAPERLRLGRELGQGGMGRVVAASLLPLNQPVAVKMVQMQALTANDSARFRREVRVLARASLCCNNVCRLLGVAQKDGALCIVMPLYEESLEQLIRRTRGRVGANGASSNAAGQPESLGGLPFLQALQVAQDVALAMAELHRQHIIVQDLKPANVLLERNGRAVVADFGISVMHASTMAVHLPTSTQGTPNYMAPEQWDPDQGRGITSKADVWAFGCLLLEMLTGEPPWKDLNMGQMCMQVGTRKASPPIPRNLPPALSALLSSCFNPEPMRRPAFPPILDELRQIWALARPREDGQGGATSPQAGQGDPDASTTARRLQEELDAVRAELAAAVAAGEAARAALESERQQREGAAREAAGREQGYQREVERLREQGVVAQTEALERARTEASRLQVEANDKDEALRGAREEVEKVKQEAAVAVAESKELLEGGKGKVEALRAEAAEMATKMARAKDEFLQFREEAVGQVAALEEEVERLQEAATASRAALMLAQKEADGLQRQWRDALAALDNAQAEVEQLRREVGDSKAGLVSAHKEVEQLRQEVGENLAALAGAREEAARYCHEAAASKAELERAMGEAERWGGEPRETGAVLEQARIDGQQIQQDWAAMATSLERAKERIAELERGASVRGAGRGEARGEVVRVVVTGQSVVGMTGGGGDSGELIPEGTPGWTSGVPPLAGNGEASIPWANRRHKTAAGTVALLPGMGDGAVAYKIAVEELKEWRMDLDKEAKRLLLEEQRLEELRSELDRMQATRAPSGAQIVAAPPALSPLTPPTVSSSTLAVSLQTPTSSMPPLMSLLPVNIHSHNAAGVVALSPATKAKSSWDALYRRLRQSIRQSGLKGCTHPRAHEDGRDLHAGSMDGEPQLPASEEGQEIYCRATLEAHKGLIWAVALTEDGRLLSGSSDSTIKVWSAEACALVAELTGHTSSVKALAVVSSTLFSGAFDHTIKVWDLSSYHCLDTLRRQGPVNALAVSADGGQLFSAEGSAIMVWTIADLTCRIKLVGHHSSIWALAVTADGHVASASGDRSVKVWHVESSRCVWESSKHSDVVTAACLGAAGQIYAGCADGRIQLWSVGQKASTASFRAHASGVECLVFRDGLLYSAARDSTIKVWITPGHGCVGKLSGHTRGVYALAIDHNGIGYSASGDKTIKVWKMPTLY